MFLRITYLVEISFFGLQKNLMSLGPCPETVSPKCFVKKVVLYISQNSQENACATVSFLIKLQASGLQLH